MSLRYFELKPESARVLNLLENRGVRVVISPIRVCDHCEDETKEAFPIHMHDENGRLRPHLCNGCFEELGLSYPERSFDEIWSIIDDLESDSDQRVV